MHYICISEKEVSIVKKAFCVFMLILTVLTSISFSSSAVNTYSYRNQWGPEVTCALNKKDVWGRRKSGTVRVSVPGWCKSVDVRMRNNGRTIWSQNDAITGNGARTVWVYRDFSLGNNYSQYKLSFRHRRDNVTPLSVKVVNRANTSVY